ncbi:DUF664 domain-containing protein [Streptomyces laculatispora]|nr:DUF664 domain-containing protein [Streptomyces laculatispora]MBO0914690.1 DUF664 domain-containing protein [Streptomyces laculatispora]
MTWTAPHITRTTAGDLQLALGTADERTMPAGWLQWHRETLLVKCAGLDREQPARTTVEPSGLTLLGLVRHLALIQDCARHNGHADRLRERIDGAIGDHPRI